MSRFQGKSVHQHKIKIVGGPKDLYESDVIPEIDQIVSLRIDGRVSGVSYAVDEKSGDLVQVIQVRAIDIADLAVEVEPGGLKVVSS